MTGKSIALVMMGCAGIFAARILLGQGTRSERFRPQFHFSPLKNWTNDPCGLVFAVAKYNLFFQFNPFANQWGHMSWGHATTADLVHWKELPVAIPEQADVAIFTGSSVVDEHNTSGLCSGAPAACIVSIYTGYTPKGGSNSEKQTQNLAYSQDGVRWTKYAGNPVLDLGKADTRDPKVFWHQPSNQWILIMVLADEKQIRIFGSPDLKHWHRLSDFGPEGAAGGAWECPDLYSLPVEGNPGQAKWVLKIGLNPGHPAGGSGEQYFIGNFDGTHFRNEAAAQVERWLDYGRDSYCELSFNHDQNGERHEIGWMDNWRYAGDAPTSPWRGAMTLAKTLQLHRQPDGTLTLMQQPVKAVETLRTDHFHYAGRAGEELDRELQRWPSRSQTFELDAAVAVKMNDNLQLALLAGPDEETVVGYDANKAQLYVDRTQCAEAHFNKEFPSRTIASLHLAPGEQLRLKIFVDRSSVEMFAQDGRVVMTNLVYPKPDSTAIRFTGPQGAVTMDVWRLRSIWQ